MTPSRRFVSYAALSVVLAGGLVACDSYENKPSSEEVVFQTRILRFELTDETPAPGDTLGVRVVIVDSTDTRFRYDWSLSGPGTLIGPDPSSEPTIRIALPGTGYSGSSTYSTNISVVIDNGTRDPPVIKVLFIDVAPGSD